MNILKLSDSDRLKLANLLSHRQYPDNVQLESLPFYIQAEWLDEADKAVDGYNVVKGLLDRGVIT